MAEDFSLLKEKKTLRYALHLKTGRLSVFPEFRTATRVQRKVVICGRKQNGHIVVHRL